MKSLIILFMIFLCTSCIDVDPLTELKNYVKARKDYKVCVNLVSPKNMAGEYCVEGVRWEKR